MSTFFSNHLMVHGMSKANLLMRRDGRGCLECMPWNSLQAYHYPRLVNTHQQVSSRDKLHGIIRYLDTQSLKRYRDRGWERKSGRDMNEVEKEKTWKKVRERKAGCPKIERHRQKPAERHTKEMGDSAGDGKKTTYSFNFHVTCLTLFFSLFRFNQKFNSPHSILN